jgi:hypothetical protein
MNGRLVRALATTTMLTVAPGPLGCGYLLHPERRGQLNGTIDSATMVMDLLWLLPGIIPGVVALIVDFSSGAIYVRGGHALRLAPDGRLAVRLPHASKPTRLAFRLVTSSRRVVAQKDVVIGPDSPNGQSLELAARRGGTATGEPMYLEVHTDTGEAARLPAEIEVAVSPSPAP